MRFRNWTARPSHTSRDQPPFDQHPDAEQLAAYAEGVLSDVDRVEVEQHLVACDDCRIVVVDTMDFLAAEQQPSGRAAAVLPFQSTRYMTGVAAALAAAAVLALAIYIARPQWLGLGPRDGPELQELIAALEKEPTRPFEGRLTGGFKYAGRPSRTRGRGDPQASLNLQIVVATIQKSVRGQKELRFRRALAASYLVVGDFDQAIAVLQEAAKERPNAAFIRSDLAAAYLERAQRSGGESDASNALAEARRALEIDASLREAAFNRALALDALRRPADAKVAWQQYIESGPVDQWTEEARQRLSDEPQSRIDLPHRETQVYL